MSEKHMSEKGISGQRLSLATLSALPETVARPGCDVAAVTTGIVHLGLGAFHRAHQAVCTDDVLAREAADDARLHDAAVTPCRCC